MLTFLNEKPRVQCGDWRASCFRSAFREFVQHLQLIFIKRNEVTDFVNLKEDK